MSECPTYGPDEDLFLTRPEYGEDYSDANSCGTLEVLNSNYELVMLGIFFLIFVRPYVF